MFAIKQDTMSVLARVDAGWTSQPNNAFYATSLMILMHHGVQLENVRTIIAEHLPHLSTHSGAVETYGDVPNWAQYLLQFYSGGYHQPYLYINHRINDEVMAHCAEICTTFYQTEIGTPDEWDVAVMTAVKENDDVTLAKYFADIEGTIIQQEKEFMLKSFQGISFGKRLLNLKQEIADLTDRIQSYTTSIQTYIKELHEKQQEYKVVKRMPDDSGKEIKDFILSDPNFVVTKNRQDAVVVEYRGVMNFFDVEKFDDEIGYDGSTMWDVVGNFGFEEYEWVPYVMEKIVYGNADLKMDSFWIISPSIGIYSDGRNCSPTYGYIPNPHLYYYKCYGGNEEALYGANRKSDWLTCLDIATMCNGGVNFEEDCTQEYFWNDVLQRLHEPVIRLHDGREINFYEAKEEWNIN